ncbi:kelch repeat-containing protein [Bacteroides sp. 51]|uniref:Kelch repeat-containing protein n=1 Tax=Bacteroides sp. 51 TaxID=2302938 RepID=UPI0013D22681|nr:kelch repeat-containing protein [Bacteroides sp. 51]NDV82774.1 galactose oxidase [Bacteroides sp. 51]
MNVIKCFFLLGTSLPLLSSCTDDSDSYTYGVWNERSDFDGKTRSGAASFTIGTQGYICGGYTGKKTEYLNDLWEYNTSGNYWTQLASMPDEAGTCRRAATGFSIGSKGYITTGYDWVDIKYLADTWEYDPAANSWAKKDDYAGGARQYALSFTIGNYGYVGTGYDDNYLKDFYRFDPTAAAGSQWQKIDGFGGTKRMGGTAFVINDAAYICTGINNGTYVNDLWKFDPSASEPWTSLRKIIDDDDDNDFDDDYTTITRAHAVSFVIDNKGYLVTGEAGGYRTDYWVYDPTTDLWNNEDFTPFEGSGRSGAVAFSTGTRGFVTTGASSSYYFDDTWELLPYELEEE